MAIHTMISSPNAFTVDDVVLPGTGQVRKVIHCNLSALPALAVGDQVQVIIPTPAWACRAFISKITNTVLADILAIYSSDSPTGTVNQIPLNSSAGASATLTTCYIAPVTNTAGTEGRPMGKYTFFMFQVNATTAPALASGVAMGFSAFE